MRFILALIFMLALPGYALARPDMRVASAAPVIETSAYSAGDVLGALTELTAIGDRGTPAMIRSLMLLDRGDQQADLDVLIFESAPDLSFGADNAAFALDDSDLDKLVFYQKIVAADYTAVGSANSAAIFLNLQGMVKPKDATKSLFIQLVARGAITYTGTDDLSVFVGLERN